MSSNDKQIHDYKLNGGVKLGAWSSHIYRSDPKHLVFNWARYKFVSKMLIDCQSILEVGCGDSFCSVMVNNPISTKKYYVAIDINKKIIEKNQQNKDLKNIIFEQVDITKSQIKHQFEGIFALDVLEHIPKEKEDDMFRNMVSSLKQTGILIIGIPSLKSFEFASTYSKIEHINLKSDVELKNLMSKYFHNTFLFSMHDEIIHTGFYPMAHYLLCIGVNKK